MPEELWMEVRDTVQETGIKTIPMEKKCKHETPPATMHTVKKGETLSAIARKYGCSVQQIMKWNNLKNADALRIGQRLKVSSR